MSALSNWAQYPVGFRAVGPESSVAPLRVNAVQHSPEPRDSIRLSLVSKPFTDHGTQRTVGVHGHSLSLYTGAGMRRQFAHDLIVRKFAEVLRFAGLQVAVEDAGVFKPLCLPLVNGVAQESPWGTVCWAFCLYLCVWY